MPQMITLSDGEQIEVLTGGDLRIAAWSLTRWLLTAGAAALIAVVLAYARLDNRVASVEQAAASASSDKRADAIEIRQLVKKVDSLTVVLGNVNDVLGDIKARLR